MSAPPYNNGQYQPDRLGPEYPEHAWQQQPQHQHQQYYQGPPPPPRSASASPYPVPPQDPAYAQDGYSYNRSGYGQQPPELLYPPGEHGPATSYGQKTGSAQEYYSDNSELHYDRQQHSPQYLSGPLQAEQRGEVEGDAADGERGLGGGLLGGVAGLVAGHKVHHGLLGALGGGIAGSLLENQLKKHGRHEQEGDSEHEHHRGHHHHHSHSRSHSHSRHRSASRNGGGSSSGSFVDDAFRPERRHHDY